MTDPNTTTELNAHPGAAADNRIVSGEREHSLFEREVSADGQVRLNAGKSVGINLGMGYVSDGKDTPVSEAAPTVHESRDLFLREQDGGLGTESARMTAESAGAGGETGEQKIVKNATQGRKRKAA